MALMELKSSTRLLKKHTEFARIASASLGFCSLIFVVVSGTVVA